MKKYIQIIIAILLTDFCLFPIALQAMQAVNFKMVLAAVGLIVFIADWVKTREMSLSHPLLWLSIISAVISLCAFVSVTVNNTSDYTFVSYIVSMLVWFFAAYCVCKYISHVHGKVNISIITKYLTAVCVMQCAFAMLIDYVPAFEHFVNSVFYDEYLDVDEFKLMHRIYGIGAALDIAGIRFACVLVLLARLIVDNDDKTFQQAAASWVAFFIIAVIGDMISRTTIIGVILGLSYYIIAIIKKNKGNINAKSKSRPALILASLAGIIAVVFFFRHNSAFQAHLKFGFEGFFNLVQTGHWSTHSTDILHTMFRWPQSLQTWLIGDGLFQDPEGHGYYMHTDVGYIRFIYYFGLPGLLSFIALYVCATHYGVKNSPEYKMIYYLLFAINMIVWSKVSSDTFVVFALLLNAGIMSSEITDKEVEDTV